MVSMVVLQDPLAKMEDAKALIGVLLCLEARDLCRLSVVDSSRQAVELADSAWCQLCKICWQSKSARYHLTPDRAHLLAVEGATWREHYKEAYMDGQRGWLRPEELSTLRWAFNFTPHAGGRGLSTMQFVEFRAGERDVSKGHLFMTGYPPLPYKLSADGKELDVSNFPRHYVKRLQTWEWEITNDNVTFVSCVDENVQYSDRGFLNLTVDDMLEQTSGLLSHAEELLGNGGAVPRHIIVLRLLHNIMRAAGQPNPDLEPGRL